MVRRQTATVLMMLLFLTPTAVMAATATGLQTIVPQQGQGSDCNGPGGCQSICDLALLAQNILNDGIYVAIFLSAILFAWAGWKHMSAGGDSHQIQEANKVFAAVFIGLIIILSAWLIVNTLMSALLGNAPTVPWNQICQP